MMNARGSNRGFMSRSLSGKYTVRSLSITKSRFFFSLSRFLARCLCCRESCKIRTDFCAVKNLYPAVRTEGTTRLKMFIRCSLYRSLALQKKQNFVSPTRFVFHALCTRVLSVAEQFFSLDPRSAFAARRVGKSNSSQARSKARKRAAP